MAQSSNSGNIITVTTTADKGPGSLREAIAKANSGATIRFADNLANKTITLTSGQISISKNVTIDASDVSNLSISGNNATRIFNVNQANTNIALRNLTLKDAYIKNDFGGAVHTTDDVKLTVDNCQFRDNVSRGGGAIFVRDRCTLNVNNSTFDGNDGTSNGNEVSGGAIGTLHKCNINVKGSTFTNNKGVNGGGIFAIFSNLNVEDSKFLNNEVFSDKLKSGSYGGAGGAIAIDGGSIPNDKRFYSRPEEGDSVGGTIRIANTRIEGNKADKEAGGLYLFGYPQDKVIVEDSTIIDNHTSNGKGGGLRVGPTQLTLRDTTIAKNTAKTQGGGLWYNGESPVNIINATFSGNQALDKNNGKGGGIYSEQWKSTTNLVNSTFANNFAGSEAGAIYKGNKQLEVTNSIFGNNKAGNQNKQQTNAELVDGGGNIQYPSPSSEEIKVTADIKFADPRLGPLQDNGGGVLTHALLSDSAAINAGVNTDAPTLDQRGYQRDKKIDAGAYEVGATAASDGDGKVMGVFRETPPITGGTGNDTLTGTQGSDEILGKEGNDSLSGDLGADVLTGGSGADRFVYSGKTQKEAFSQSQINMLDRITDFNPTEGDRIQLDYDGNLSTIERPQKLFNAGEMKGNSLSAAIQSAYADKNPRNQGKQALKGNEAVLFTWQGSTYLSVNDKTKSFGADRDLVVDVTGITMPSQNTGVLKARNFFV